MKYVIIIVRMLLGLIFAVFGSNAFLHFMPMQPMEGPAGAFIGALASSGYIYVIGALQVVGGLCLLVGARFVPLGLTLLGPVIVNILLFHITMDPKGIVPGTIATICWLLVFSRVRPAFAGIFQRRVPEPVIGHQ